MKKIKIILTIAFAVISSCACTRRIYVPTVRSTTIIDTLVQTVADSALVNAVFACDSLNQVYIKQLDQYKGEQAKQKVTFSENKLKIETRWKTKYVDRMIAVHDTVTVVQIQKVDKIVKQIPPFFWWCFAIAFAALIYIVLKIFVKK